MQQDPDECLDDDAVVALLGGLSSDGIAQRAQHHLDHCAKCRELVELFLNGEKSIGPSTVRDTGVLSKRGQLGRYLLLELLGAGGMGVVYSAYDPTLDRKVALKLLRNSDGQDGPRQAELLEEAKTLARLAHPN